MPRAPAAVPGGGYGRPGASPSWSPIWLTAATVKSLLIWTSTSVPSALRMCASSGALPSTLVSTGSTVAETLASDAPQTFCAVVQVRDSSGRPSTVCRPCEVDAALDPVDDVADEAA